MTKIKPSQVSGFPEWLPSQKILENQFIDKIARYFESFGFIPIETPAVERDEVLSSKGEINKQIYSLYRPNVETDKERDTGLSLHFDLTIPLARYVAQYHNSLVFPFKRYQIQKVWRGERAQRGRFREFYQCDIDIIGDGELDLYADAEVAYIIYLIFKELAFGPFKIHISNRKLLLGIIEAFNSKKGEALEFIQILDKIEHSDPGMDKIKMLLIERIGSDEGLISLFDALLSPGTSNEKKLSLLKSQDFLTQDFMQGVNELSELYNNLVLLGCNDKDINIDISIVRGLDYYTGSVFETFLVGHEKGLGSVCSGGRYDDLASHFISKRLPGVGISIGLTRLLSYVFEKGIIKTDRAGLSMVMIALLDRRYLKRYIEWLCFLNSNTINSEIYIQDAPLKKQIVYADRKGIDFVILFGADEERLGIIKLKDMRNNTQTTFPQDKGIELILDHILQGDS